MKSKLFMLVFGIPWWNGWELERGSESDIHSHLRKRMPFIFLTIILVVTINAL